MHFVRCSKNQPPLVVGPITPSPCPIKLQEPVYQFGLQEPGSVTPAFAGVQIQSLFGFSNGFRLAPE